MPEYDPDPSVMDSITLANQYAKSHDTRRRCGPGQRLPVYPRPQHRKLRRGQPGGALGRRRPGKTPLLQDLVVEAEPVAVPGQKFDPVTPAALGRRRPRPRPDPGAGPVAPAPPDPKYPSACRWPRRRDTREIGRAHV